MKFSDILALAKQGYSPQDIKDLLALATEDTQTGTEGEAAEPEKAPATETEADEPGRIFMIGVQGSSICRGICGQGPHGNVCTSVTLNEHEGEQYEIF